MYVAMVLEAPSDRTDAWEVTHGMSNSCNEPMIDRNIQIRMVGPSSGMVICRWICHQLAPSIAAASVNSSGMFDRPARKRMSAKPVYFQVSTNRNVQMTTLRLASH